MKEFVKNQLAAIITTIVMSAIAAVYATHITVSEFTVAIEYMQRDIARNEQSAKEAHARINHWIGKKTF